ncbi:MAG TPA: hypothetical protein ENI51_00955, partial [Candidatus Atribacteria bacterium]|nr:hypothetical protein [Candidatus Atribacteria bacterium]
MRIKKIQINTFFVFLIVLSFMSSIIFSYCGTSEECEAPDETCENCPEDCGECDYDCGNGACETDLGESCENCEADCGSCEEPHCGDGDCSWPETCESCPADCGACDDPGRCDADNPCSPEDCNCNDRSTCVCSPQGICYCHWEDPGECVDNNDCGPFCQGSTTCSSGVLV